MSENENEINYLMREVSYLKDRCNVLETTIEKLITKVESQSSLIGKIISTLEYVVLKKI